MNFQSLINLHNRNLWPWIIICGALLGFLYQILVIGGAEDKFREFKKRINVTQKETIVSLDIPIKDTYLLKLKGGFKENNQPRRVFVNGHLLKEYKSERKQVSGVKYRIIPSDLIHKGENQLKIYCPGDYYPFQLRIIYRNYRMAYNHKQIFLLFDSSRYLSKIYETLRVTTKILLGALLLCSLWIVISRGWIRILYFSERIIYLYALFSFLPALLFLFIVYSVSIFSSYHIVFTMRYFWTFVISLICMFNVYLSSRRMWLQYKTSRHLSKCLSFSQYLKSNKVFKLSSLNEYAYMSLVWVKGRELCYKLILSFMPLLVICALLLILGAWLIAEIFASAAYFALVIGVGIKFVKVIKEERTR